MLTSKTVSHPASITDTYKGQERHTKSRDAQDGAKDTKQTKHDMNQQENAAASELLQQIKDQARQTPEKALELAKAYRELCKAAKLTRKSSGPPPAELHEWAEHHGIKTYSR